VCVLCAYYIRCHVRKNVVPCGHFWGKALDLSFLFPHFSFVLNAKKRTPDARKKHTDASTTARYTHARDEFFIPSVQLVPSRRVPGGDKRSVRFARFIPFGKRGEGLLRVSIVHRAGVLSGAFVLAFFQTHSIRCFLVILVSLSLSLSVHLSLRVSEVFRRSFFRVDV
jgi:hypothetical protein